MKAKIKLNPAVTFEGKEYTELDFSELSEWSSLKYNDVANRCRTAYPSIGNGGIETRAEFAWFIGNEVTKLPIEFFQQLPPKLVRAITLIIAKNFIVTDSDLEEMLEIEE